MNADSAMLDNYYAKADGVEQTVVTTVAMHASCKEGIPALYYTEDVSNKVVKIIQSYTGVVNKMVWRKARWEMQ